IVAQPPTRLANATQDYAHYTPTYVCDSDDPLAACSLIDNFIAAEMPVGSAGNATMKLVVVAQQQTAGANATSQLSVYDEF
ncbi:hypothetical protein OFD71_42070, partial [Escherichia coli]|nr:hypothetical protein [Escherichia coli]